MSGRMDWMVVAGVNDDDGGSRWKNFFSVQGNPKQKGEVLSQI